MTESAIQRDIVTAGRAMGAKVYRLNAGKVRVKGGFMELAEDGTPDLLTVWPRGRLLFVEVKRPKEQPTVIQKLRHRELRNMGHAVCTAHSVEEFIEAMREMEV